MAFVQYMFAPQAEGTGALAGRSKKLFVSAGALHPISPIIVSGPGVTEPILFDDPNGGFLALPVGSTTSFDASVSEAQSVLPSAGGHLILFVGDLGQVSSHYSKPESLLWRDAGAVLQACALAASAFDYAFCPIGMLGGSMLLSLKPPDDQIIAVGMAMIGVERG